MVSNTQLDRLIEQYVGMPLCPTLSRGYHVASGSEYDALKELAKSYAIEDLVQLLELMNRLSDIEYARLCREARRVLERVREEARRRIATVLDGKHVCVE
jgi:hypothetical protein